MIADFAPRPCPWLGFPIAISRSSVCPSYSKASARQQFSGIVIRKCELPVHIVVDKRLGRLPRGKSFLADLMKNGPSSLTFRLIKESLGYTVGSGKKKDSVGWKT